MEPPFVLDDDGFLAVSGIPTLESLEDSSQSIPGKLRNTLRNKGPQWLYENVGGAFNIGSLTVNDAGQLTLSAFADFSGYCSLFYLDTPNFFAIGNRASFVGAFRPGFPVQNEIDADALSWVVGTTMIMGTRTPFAKVSRLRTGYGITYSTKLGESASSAKISRMVPHHFGSIANVSIDDFDYTNVCTRIGNRMRWCVDQGIQFRAHLTGGRDTRLMAGVLANQEALEAVDRFSTLGTEQNGDVIVAKQLAAALGVENRHFVAEGGKGEVTISADDFCAIVRRSPFMYECHLSAWDGRRSLVRRVPAWVTLMGGGGEVYRQEWGSSESLAGSQGAQRALSMFSRYDALRLLSMEARQHQLQEIEIELNLLRDEGVVNLASAFYLEERLANWGCGHFSNSLTTQFPMLLDWELARSALSVDGISEHVHFDMLRHCGDYLLRMPFLNKRWADDTEQRARRAGLAPDPVQVPLERNFPWQFDCYRRFRNAIIDFCLECGESLRAQVPVSNLERLRALPIEPFGSAHVKMLFGLCGAIFLLEGASGGDRDLAGSAPAETHGNSVSLIQRAVFNYKVEGSDVAAHLAKRLSGL